MKISNDFICFNLVRKSFGKGFLMQQIPNNFFKIWSLTI